MKKLIVLLAILSTGFFSCNKDNTLPVVETETSALENATVIAAGKLSFTSKTNTGSAIIYRQKNSQYILGLEKMNLNTGTSLVIYLSSTTTVSSSSVKICSVENLYGDVFRPLPDHIDFSLFKYVIIQTEPWEEVVASAELN
jgi:hypothetical protein